MNSRSDLPAPGERRGSRLWSTWLTTPCLFGVLLCSTNARALTWDEFSLSAHGMYGVQLADESLENPYGVGLDLHAGVTLPASVYAGASLSHFFGEVVSYTLLSDPAIDVERRAAFTQVLAHLGYDWQLDGVLLRPNLGVGYAHARLESSGTRLAERTTTRSVDHALALSPGVDLRFPMGAISTSVQLSYHRLLLEDEAQSALLVGFGFGI